MCDEPRPAVAIGNGQRLHQVPAGEVGARDVTHLALADKFVQRVLHLFDRGQGVETVQMVDVHVVRAQAAQAALERPPQVVSRRSLIVHSVARRKARFG